jgi:hypothetical protein
MYPQYNNIKKNFWCWNCLNKWKHVLFVHQPVVKMKSREISSLWVTVSMVATITVFDLSYQKTGHPCSISDDHNYKVTHTDRHLNISLFFPLGFWDTVLLCDPGWPQTCDPPASASWVMELQSCTTMFWPISLWTRIPMCVLLVYLNVYACKNMFISYFIV